MLCRLFIENIAVIERADIDLSGGLNILTGETGAGKSILIDSIMAVLGERTSRELIRTGAKSASVSAEFSGIGEKAAAALAEYGIEQEDDTVILSRELKVDGRGGFRINSRPVTSSVLKAVGRQLINIHGQHDNQSLLDPQKHIELLDSMLENAAVREDYDALYSQMTQAKKALAGVTMDESDKARKIDLLRYQIREIDKAEIEPGELDELKKRREVCMNFERIRDAAACACGYLDGDDENDGSLSGVQQAAQELSDITGFSDELDELSNRLHDLSYELEDIAQELRSQLDDMEFDPQELEDIENRLSVLRRIIKKYGGEEEALAFRDKAKKELAKIELSDERREQLEKEYNSLLSQTKKAAKELSDERKKAGKIIARRIGEELTFLDMPSVCFEVSIQPCELSSSGCDTVEFLISTNPGEPPRPIHKIASGGELSRIMLAIKNVLADKDDIDTLIFDEIDTGVSGRAAQKIGIKLKAVSRNRQIICITHLAQIAAFADVHLLIKKNVTDGRTYTTVSELDREQRIHELAVINGGDGISSAQLASAQELLEFAEKNS